ncbi:MAG: methyltransferase domain-containing protein [Spirochaetia bacterium]
MGIESFPDYLEAKRAADERARDIQTFELFVNALKARNAPRVLDAGTGTGAMARRLLAALPDSDCQVIGVDTSAESIEVASAAGRVYAAERLQFEQVSLFSPEAKNTLQPLAAITAHSFVDEFPPDLFLHTCAQLLEGEGLVYTSLTYNGRTEFWPESSDAQYERRLLELYDRSMDERKFQGQATGGSRGASRLLAAAERHGFSIVCFGGSDWCIQPWRNGYMDGDHRLLEGMVDFVANEANTHQEMNESRTEAWREERSAQIRAKRLRLMVHHLDSLLRTPA